MGRDRKSQPRVHPARVALHLRVDEPLDSSELDNVVEARGDFRPPHTHDRALQIHVFASCQIGVKPCGDLDERSGAPDDSARSTRRFEDARQQLQYRGLARAVAADDAERFAGVHLEVDALQCPEHVVVNLAAPTEGAPHQRR